MRHGIKVAGGTTTAITPIQMVCTKAEITHKVLHGSHFEDKAHRDQNSTSMVSFVIVASLS